MLESIGVPLDRLKFVRGTDYQLSRYVMHLATCVLVLIAWQKLVVVVSFSCSVISAST